MYGYGYSPFVKNTVGTSGAVPVNTVTPVISGSLVVGSTLTCSTGTWTGTLPITYSYQWYSNYNPISGQTNNTYVTQNSDVGVFVYCSVTATNAFGSVTIGSSAVTPTWEADAQAFITAASITDPTQQAAINQLVVDLKGYNVWSKMQALYPFVGGTASSHSYNLKNTAQFQITWNGGVTHSSTGVTGNGTNGYGNTGLLPSTQLSLNNTHISYYTRTNNNGSTWAEAGVLNGNQGIFIIPKFDGSATGAYRAVNSSQVGPNTSPTDVRGLYIASRITSGAMKLYGNSSTLFNDTQASGALFSLGNVFLLASNVTGAANYFSGRQAAFASIGDGLTDTEAANFYTAVQTFQTTLGRSIGTQTVSDPDAQAFVTNAGIVDQVEAKAVNNLVIGLKSDGLWSKMKAIYPMVGSSATSNSYNLKNTAQYQITWYGGLTHNANGVTGSGTNGYGDTFLNNNVLAQNDNHLSVYIRTSGGNTGNDLASWNGSTFGMSMYTNFLGGFTAANNSGGAYFTFTQGTQGGLYINRRISATQFIQQRNLLKQTNNNNSSNHITTSFKLLRTGDFNGEYSNKNIAFASIGDGLNDTEATNLYTRVQAFNTALNRQVGTPIPPTGFLLNDYPDARGAYSVARRLSNTYTGNLIRVRRSSDNAEQNIGYTGANVLDEAALTSFVGANDGFVTTWYDQSGNNLNIIQTTANKQPKIVNAGVVIKTNGKAAMQFDGSNDELTQASLRGDTRADQYYVIQATDSQYLYPNYLGSAYGFVAQDGSASNGAGNSYGSPTLYVNNALTSTATRNDVHDALNGQKIALHENSNTATGWATIAWGAYAGFEFSGLWQEYIYYNSDQSANRTGINNNINGFYTIY